MPCHQALAPLKPQQRKLLKVQKTLQQEAVYEVVSKKGFSSSPATFQMLPSNFLWNSTKKEPLSTWGQVKGWVLTSPYNLSMLLGRGSVLMSWVKHSNYSALFFPQYIIHPGLTVCLWEETDWMLNQRDDFQLLSDICSERKGRGKGNGSGMFLSPGICVSGRLSTNSNAGVLILASSVNMSEGHMFFSKITTFFFQWKCWGEKTISLVYKNKKNLWNSR